MKMRDRKEESRGNREKSGKERRKDKHDGLQEILDKMGGT